MDDELNGPPGPIDGETAELPAFFPLVPDLTSADSVVGEEFEALTQPPVPPAVNQGASSETSAVEPLSDVVIDVPLMPAGARSIGSPAPAPADVLPSGVPLVESVDDPLTPGVDLALAEARLSGLETSLATMATALKQISLREDVGRKALSELHTEMTEYKEDFLLKALMPTMRALVRLMDDVEKVGAPGRDVTVGDMRYLGDQILDMLEEHGGSSILDPEGAKVDGSRHKVVASVATRDAALHGTIARTNTKGWFLDGRLLRPQIVEAYRFEADTTEEPTTAVGEVGDPATGGSGSMEVRESPATAGPRAEGSTEDTDDTRGGELE